ncbi:Tad domain-containing protein [Azotobacter chroococcum]|uniref:Tad domain-containing protein n=1 Tax=Azotobacter chroococcum TaxID=353 RepID=UPI000B788A09|nr:Tad domain-containing protein [Azotobacter chroococcum]
MKLRSLHAFKAAPRRQRGAVLVLLTVAMVALLAMAALALDGGHLMVNKTRLQNAVDAAALSGAKTLSLAYGSTGAGSTSAAAAWKTLRMNANAPGNEELAKVLPAAGSESNFASVEFASSVYGPFSPTLPTDGRYVRVTVQNYGLAGFFWGVLEMFTDSPPDKRVAAIAVAGPSPTAPCDLAPLLVCGDLSKPPTSTSTDFWGYKFGQLEVLKSTNWKDGDVGPGNFQLLDLGSGGKTVSEALEGGVNQCYSIGESVDTEPGNKVGPVRSGFNTRFEGATRDLVPYYDEPLLKYDDAFDPPIAKSGQAVKSDDDGDVYVDGGSGIYDYNDWRAAMAACTPTNSCLGAVAERRMLKIVVGNCDVPEASGEGVANAGKVGIPVLGFGCFFVLQPIAENGGGGGGGGGGGNESYIFGQFVEACNGDSYPGPNPSSDAGPQIIQLYKTYITPGQPGSDS